VLLRDVRAELDKGSSWPGGRLDLRPCPDDGLVNQPAAGFSVKGAQDVTLAPALSRGGSRGPTMFATRCRRTA
jgi:hypothetical protein